jgi:signal transduction histidine kinase
LSKRLVDVQERERRAIARELHDQIGQLLTGLKLILEMSVRAPREAAEENLEEAKSLVGELMKRVRELSLDLRPAMLDDLGLLPALLWLFERYTAQTQIQIRFRHTGLEGQRFSPEVETAAYRIIQEALTNAARHAEVDGVIVRLWLQKEVVNLQVEDHGRGFDAEWVRTSGAHSGLSGMFERASMMGGRLTVESHPGNGTLVSAELPLKERLERRKRGRWDW